MLSWRLTNASDFASNVGISTVSRIFIGRRYDPQDALVQSDQSVSLDLVQLYKALGGGWNDEQKPEQLSAHR
jgi:hypothetical protein